jgi:hypothetical protein
LTTLRSILMLYLTIRLLTTRGGKNMTLQPALIVYLNGQIAAGLAPERIRSMRAMLAEWGPNGSGRGRLVSVRTTAR